MSRLFVVILFVLSVGVRTTSSAGSRRSILRAIDEITDNVVDRPDVGVELNATNFDSVLRDSLATHAIVEFFAHWCPACRNYKPHYERVARLFNGPGAVHPGIILMTRVDCALKINTKLCDKFSVGHYPMLFWGPPSKFVSGSWKPQQEKGDISVIDDGRTADRLLNWINKKIGSSYGLDDPKFEGSHVSSNMSDLQIVRALHDVEEATSTAFDIIAGHKIKSDTRPALITFLQLLVAHHPSWRCRKGSAGILVNFDDLYPSDPLSSEEKDAIGPQGGLMDNFQICGKEVPRGYWVFCRGSKNETRGFSCGLWLLLHSLSVRIENEESQFAFRATCDFIHNFFFCEECSQHFYEMCSSVTSPFTKSRDFAIWLWDAHNKVNERLMKEEASLGTGDPKFPKIIWPPEQLCPSCFISQSRKRNATNRIEWDHDEVFKFLRGYYGVKLMSLYKDKGVVKGGIKLMAGTGGDADDTAVSTNAVVVPVGAALAIAFASCAFGVLAWFWRSQQKNRKYPHHLHSFKET